MPRTYTGPSVADMVRNKSFAENIVKYHNHPTSDSILDDENLNLLQRFVDNPDQRERILKDESIDPDAPLEGQQAGLAAYVIWTYGRKDLEESLLKEGDIEILKRWFDNGKQPVEA